MCGTPVAMSNKNASNAPLAAGDGSSDRSLAIRDELRHARNLSAAFRSVAKELAPSVVSVNTVDRPPYDGQSGPIIMPRGARLPDRQGKGSGVIVSGDGFILTNLHVVRGSDEIMIRLTDRRELPASLVGVDPDTDLAVLKVEASDLIAARFGDSESIEIGDWVLALGNPFGLEQSVTAGIISAKGRSGMGLATYENFLQTDAAINPGNSGGPLVDLDGRVVGINTAISGPDGANHGIGFAIPASMAQRVVDELIEQGRVLRGWLGVSVGPVIDGSKLLPGAALVFVGANTPASAAGLRRGDVILRLDDQALESPSDFIKSIGDRAPESTVRVTFLRNGESMHAMARLGERPTPIVAQSTRGQDSADSAAPPTRGPPRSTPPPATERRRSERAQPVE
ncbi:MAG: trypsin-like serine protease [Phycisphaerae bacterium]|nr:trypsin-like serine protease [Phycisphaerae bacterium]